MHKGCYYVKWGSYECAGLQIFSSNPYFEDTKLTKVFRFSDEGTTSVSGTQPRWKDGMVIFLFTCVERFSCWFMIIMLIGFLAISEYLTTSGFVLQWEITLQGFFLNCVNHVTALWRKIKGGCDQHYLDMFAMLWWSLFILILWELY